MAITLIEDGTGTADAVAYSTSADCSAWLVANGLHAFSALDSIDQDDRLIAATRWVERKSEPRLTGARRFTSSTLVQSLAYPRVGAYRRTGDGISSDEIPVEYVRAIYLAAEHKAVNPRRGEPQEAVLRVGRVGAASFQLEDERAEDLPGDVMAKVDMVARALGEMQCG